ncbi:hybrid sensor histidine kinase/response regulator transcription factor [Geofilum rubicundum]|uniref:histidine kinase n=1 Tax=Geofilum rubicundum JCM 15548 TaxID=1236989 RepID=A0A0E9LT39_9BACT|nr:two-component regulator propeller domain-containing protein [Geofilum rubicundum]GAO28399.1 DNA-binding response regulator, AraC family [Geofilum rubicundum JCM 15548]
MGSKSATIGKYLIFLFFLILETSIQAQSQLSIENITSRDGLSQNTVTSMAEDHRGFLWFGTLNGLNRFDGTRFHVLQQEYGEELSLSDNRIRTLFYDPDGYIWAITNTNHFNCYNIHLQRFEKFEGNQTSYGSFLQASNGNIWLWDHHNGCLLIQKEDGQIVTTTFATELNNIQVYFLTEGADQSVYIATNNALFRYHHGTLKRIVQEGIMGMLEDNENLYLFTRNAELKIIRKTTNQLKNTEELPEYLRTAEVLKTEKLKENHYLLAKASGLFLFNTEQNATFSSAARLFDGEEIRDARFLKDNKGQLWLYNNSGKIWQYQEAKEKFICHNLIPPEIMATIDLERYSIWHDSKDIIWISTYGNGLFALDQQSGEISHLKHHPDRYNQIPTNYLLSVSEDQSGEIWAGTEHGGLIKISRKQSVSETFIPGNDETERNKIVRLVFQDQQNRIWIGTKKGLLYVYSSDLKTLLWEYTFNRGLPYTAYEDPEGNIWIGTKGQGLLVIDPDFSVLYQSGPDSEQDKNIYDILRDQNGRMWIGTYGKGILLAAFKNNRVQYQNFSEINQQQSRVRSLVQDRKGRIWVGGNNGLFTFLPDSLLNNPKAFHNFHYSRRNPLSLANNEVKAILEDRSGQLWIGTSGGGINKVLEGNPIYQTRFEHYNINHGLVNNIVQDIRQDMEGNLWISTESGLSKFNTANQTFENIKLSDSWEGDLLSESASCRLHNGTLLFGSHSGLHRINPGREEKHKNLPPVYLTSLDINGEMVLPGRPKSPLSQALYNTQTLELSHQQRNINIHFTLPDYLNPEANTYTFILEGFEEQWNHLTRHSFASYRNLPPGDYTFRVKAKNSQGIWSDSEARLPIRVNGPWWQSTLAFLIYSVVIALLIYAVNTAIRRMDRLSAEIKIEKDLTAYKLQFFTNISHEFRTPLTIIKGTIENVRQSQDPAFISREVGFLEKSSERLLRMIDQLLEFRKLQSNIPVVRPTPLELVSHIKNISSHFDSQANRKKIKLTLSSSHTHYAGLIDEGILEKTLHNLLSNALKFTPQNGAVNVSLHIDEALGQMTLRVDDSGPGIATALLPELFHRFKRFDSDMPGTGIGLNLIHELLKAHNGSIHYEDSPIGGAGFVVKVPVNPCAADSTQALRPIAPETDTFAPVATPGAQKTNKQILIIEDDPEIAEYLQHHLSRQFRVRTAPNGKKGLQLSEKTQPDLILCDIMMPEMNGYEVTKHLKSGMATCHIPIILLTAYTAEEFQFKGFDAGADAYITKPFSLDLLKLRITKLLEQREVIKQKYASTPDLSTLPENANDKDAQFLQSIHAFIDAHISDPQLSVERIMETTKMGRTLFYHKVKGLTGFSPNDLIKTIRLKKAAELLQNEDLNVSETALAVGMEDPYYFSKCFKKQFGQTPSEFIKKQTTAC